MIIEVLEPSWGLSACSVRDEDDLGTMQVVAIGLGANATLDECLRSDRAGHADTDAAHVSVEWILESTRTHDPAWERAILGLADLQPELGQLSIRMPVSRTP